MAALGDEINCDSGAGTTKAFLDRLHPHTFDPTLNPARKANGEAESCSGWLSSPCADDADIDYTAELAELRKFLKLAEQGEAYCCDRTRYSSSL